MGVTRRDKADYVSFFKFAFLLLWVLLNRVPRSTGFLPVCTTQACYVIALAV